MHLEEILKSALARVPTGTCTARSFLDHLQVKPRYAIGKNAETLSAHSLAPLRAIIDDLAQKGSLWSGIPLIHTKDAQKDGFVLNCSTSIRPVDTVDHLVATGFRNIVSLPDLIHAANGAFPLPDFVERQRYEMRQNSGTWQEIYDTLEDETSRRTLMDVLLFRLTADPSYMRSYSVRIHDQYFEEFMEYQKEVFVDAGAFDGDTTEEFSNRYPDYKKVLIFEPSMRNMQLARQRLANLRDLTYFPIGLSDTAGHLSFDQEKGSASSVSSSGEDQIPVDSLDTVVSEPVTFIKMDLEGWELPALKGAERHLREDKPKLAIAVYHDAPDLRHIFRFIQSFKHDYQVYLRHYTQGWSETIMFFTPRK